MIRLILFLVLILSWKLLIAQNLISNGDFENYIICDSAVGWKSPTLGSPDYMNACNTGSWGVPVNFAGTEFAHSGVGYYGLLIKNSGSNTIEWREYIQTQLIAPMIVGNSYCLSMYVSLADNLSQYGSDDIGALLSTGPVSRNDNFRFTQIPQAVNQSGNYIVNKNGWKQISISFIADSAYFYITIGNFLDDANTSVVPVSGGTWPRSYFFIDDVSLTQANNCETVGVNDLFNVDITVYPNPFSNELNLNTSKPIEFILFDRLGRIVIQEHTANSKSISVSHLSKGIYIYELRDSNVIIQRGKIVME